MKLAGKVAIVTGGASGIGQAASLLFAKEGARVVVADVATTAGQDTVSRIKADGGNALFVKTDVACSADVEAMVRVAVDTYGRLDVLVNNAGVDVPAKVTEVTDEVWALNLDVNLKGVMLGCKYAIPEMLKAGGGAIVNIGSMAGLVASPGQAPYCSAKGGVTLLTKQVAIDFARDNVRVNCICPSEVDTPMQRQFIDQSPDPEATRRRVMGRIPLGRVARPDEIATVILFLACEDSSYVTGAVLPVDGGLTAL